MKERTMRRSQYRPGAEHRISDFDERPAQIYAQAMAAAKIRRLGGLAALFAGLAPRRRRRA
jgi:hypothetical protein